MLMTGQGQLLPWICRTISLETDCLALFSVSRPIAKKKKTQKNTLQANTEHLRPNMKFVDLLTGNILKIILCLSVCGTFLSAI